MKKLKKLEPSEAQKAYTFLMLEMIGCQVGLFTEGSTKFRGRKPNGFENLDLNDSDQLALAISKIQSSH